MDIRDFHCHKNVNFRNIFVGLAIADDLKCKILKVYGNIFLLHLLIRVQNTTIEKKYENLFA